MWKYPKEILEETLKESTSNREEWQKKVLEGFASILKKNPARYRGYGCYWWLLKQEFLKVGNEKFGVFLDAELVETTDYGDSALNLMACLLYGNQRLDMGLQENAFHTLAMDESGEETREYGLVDEDMEIDVIKQRSNA